jgi:iron complex transport system ATP-binding protein
MTLVLEARDLVVARGGCAVLHGISLDVSTGDGLALIGPNAAGKSTLLRALAGLLPAQSGTIVLKGRPLAEWRRGAQARVVALVTSEDEGGDAFTVEERVALGRYPHRGPFQALDASDRSAVRAALEHTGIADRAMRRVSTLSAGERQLAALARGLAQEPELLLLDEPAAHLDIGHQLQLFRVLDEARARGVAVVAVIHDLQRAAAWATRVVLLAEGRVAAAGAPDGVLAGEACGRAFGVNVRAHAVPGVRHSVYSFESSDR